MNVEVTIIDSKNYGLYVNGVLLGTSKLHCDAMLAKHTLEAALAAEPVTLTEEKVRRIVERMRSVALEQETVSSNRVDSWVNQLNALLAQPAPAAPEKCTVCYPVYCALDRGHDGPCKPAPTPEPLPQPTSEPLPQPMS